MNKTISKILSFSLVSLFLGICVCSAVAESNTQILALNNSNNSTNSNKQNCGDYSLDAANIFLANSGNNSGAKGGEIKLIDEQSNLITNKQLGDGQSGTLEIGIVNKTSLQVGTIKIRLLTKSSNNEFAKYDETLLLEDSSDNAPGNTRKISFEKPLSSGTYQIELSCPQRGVPIAFAVTSAGLGVGAIVGNNSSSSGGSPSVAPAPAPIPEVTPPIPDPQPAASP